MIINWYGENCFKLQTGGITILIDPFESGNGLTPPRFKADITLYTTTSLPLSNDDITPGTIKGPGEYEIKGVHVFGWMLEKTESEIRSAYTVKTEDFTLSFLGNPKNIPGPETAEHAIGADIVFIPVGGAPSLDGTAAAKVVKQLSPKIVIPSAFKISGLTRKADSVSGFLKELGQEATPQEKLTIKKKEVPQSTQAIVLSI